jgi:hypothetical protein
LQGEAFAIREAIKTFADIPVGIEFDAAIIVHAAVQQSLFFLATI